MPSPSDAPNGACVLHRPPDEGQSWVLADAGYLTCAACLARLRDRLTEISSLYARLNPRPGAYSSGGVRGAPGFDSRPPANLHIICLRDTRSSPTWHTWVAADGRVHDESEHPPLCAQNVLNTAAWATAEQFEMVGPEDDATVDELALWLDRRLDRITKHGPSVLALDYQIRTLVGQLRIATGVRTPAVLIGQCPNTIDRGDYGEPCGANLFAPQVGDTIRCRECGERWPRAKWERLGQLMQNAVAS